MSRYWGSQNNVEWTDTAWPAPSNAPRVVRDFKAQDVICLPLAEVRAMCPRLAPKPTAKPQTGCLMNFAPVRH
jgi:hypothetical protein